MKHPLPVLLFLFLLAPLLQAAPKPQFDLPTATLSIGTNTINAQIASDEASRERGLMSRTNLSEREAMLFVFPKPQPVAFWMKDTPVPLSVAYLGPSGRIFEIHDLKPLDETPVPSTSEAVSYALEVPKGWFSQHGVFAGSTIGGLPLTSTAK